MKCEFPNASHGSSSRHVFTNFLDMNLRIFFVSNIMYNVIIEKSCGGRFLRNRNWYLGWIWAGWHYWKKTFGPIMSNFCGRFFSSFCGQRKNQKHCNVCTKKLYRMKLRGFFFWSDLISFYFFLYMLRNIFNCVLLQ